MPIKKSELYSKLWSSCDELRGGMDASQYKDYVLVLLFIKYVSDKYADKPYAPITIPKGSSFKDMAALKGKSDIGDQINKKIVGPLSNANKLSDMPDFNDATKLGSGKEMVDRLTNLIAIFEDKALDFSKNRAEGDDILGDAYEYLMRHFATESGKSKGQFYTPAEVSRIMAQIVGIKNAKTGADTTVYDPTCGSGSLLLKVADEAKTPVTLYGQEKDAATSGLARMNMILHNNPTALIAQGNTLTDPKFMEKDTLKTYDYVVANPPFSDKRWSTGLDPSNDSHRRFESFGVPPSKQGDYAYLLHIVRSLKSTGKGACILPHGVLFRGNAEAEIRRNLIRKGYIKGIIGLPANLFYGTGIPACIVVVDKQGAEARKGIFMVDASSGFMKDGPKNRLRAQDIHKIVDIFNRQLEVPKYSRMVDTAEIEKNEFNLNLPRYIDSQTPEDAQDIEGHLQGGIPASDVEALNRYWEVCPTLKSALFHKNRKGYLDLKVDKAALKSAIYEHAEFADFIVQMNAHFSAWRKKIAAKLKALEPGFHPKELVVTISESLLTHYADKPLIDRYDIYQHLLDYWDQTMQDDAYLIASDGWNAETYRIIETDKKGKEKDKGWTCDLVPKPLIVARYFKNEQAGIDRLTTALESASAKLAELEEENSGEDGAFLEPVKVKKAEVAARLKEIKGNKDAKDEAALLNAWLALNAEEAELKKQLNDAESALDAKALAHYPKLTESDVKSLVVDDKWLAALDAAVHSEMERISQSLTKRVKELAERYESPLPDLENRATELEAKVKGHLERMGFTQGAMSELLQGAMQELLTGKRRLPGFEAKRGFKQSEVGVIPVDWEVKALGSVACYTNGKAHEGSISDSGNYVVVNSKFISTNGEIRKYSAQRFSPASKGEVLMVMSDVPNGRAIAKCFFTDRDDLYTVNQRICALRPLQIDGRLLFYKLNRNPFYLAFDDGVKQTNLRKDDVLLCPIALPPTLAEQSAIAEVLSDMDAEIAALEGKLSKARLIKQGMMLELLTGRIRLV